MDNIPLVQRCRRRSKQSNKRIVQPRPTKSQQIKLMLLKEFGKCRCGEPIHPIYVNRCEDCWAVDQVRWSGRSQRVKVLFNE